MCRYMFFGENDAMKVWWLNQVLLYVEVLGKHLNRYITSSKFDKKQYGISGKESSKAGQEAEKFRWVLKIFEKKN